ncbi:MAG: nascent polypeptide-associated complex protein [Nanoarchaeota archaeon]|nr:nascent polypeptide-associated complex protein [Nanoarchaeota archaeon]MBU1031206.1 nascent polypeptide-associated complex protein [Nanoarchaeota archaeon]MBU1850332.1 nascent polypeptide-associated complex protein [Nanoarchaeota archaeon]
MIPGMNMNSRQMRMAMKKMGLQQQEIDAKEVIIRLEDREIVLVNPQVTKVNMMGQETYQITGEEYERSIDSTPEISDEDIQTVVNQTNCSEEEAKKAIIEVKGDLAEAIMNLQK